MKKHSEVFENSEGLEEKFTQNQLLAMQHNAWLFEKDYVNENIYRGNNHLIEIPECFIAFDHLGNLRMIYCEWSKPEKLLIDDLNASENGAWVFNVLRNKK